ncbi:hypothetical protein EYF80_033582 [Liparis tanakae]|uniref:Uncharacterized protein n=1 Tax=Liparis tanakae TaxID=230148 RepID=A0A4Z2GRV2_9TELE|nr:hypothetical protein EYF80_033582 [Liparis tanakae]
MHCGVGGRAAGATAVHREAPGGGGTAAVLGAPGPKGVIWQGGWGRWEAGRWSPGRSPAVGARGCGSGCEVRPWPPLPPPPTLLSLALYATERSMQKKHEGSWQDLADVEMNPVIWASCEERAASPFPPTLRHGVVTVPGNEPARRPGRRFHRIVSNRQRLEEVDVVLSGKSGTASSGERALRHADVAKRRRLFTE